MSKRLENIVNALNEIYQRSVNDRKENQRAFLELYEMLVTNLDPGLAEEIGSISAKGFVHTKNHTSWGVQLNAADLLWWKNEIKKAKGKILFRSRNEITSAFIQGILNNVSTKGIVMSKEDNNLLLSLQVEDDDE